MEAESESTLPQKGPGSAPKIHSPEGLEGQPQAAIAEAVVLPQKPDVPRLPPSPVTGYALPASVLWPKGASANPGGVPKGKRISTRMMEMQGMTRAQLEAIKANDNAEVRDHLAARALLRSMKDDDAHADFKEVLDRTEGPLDRTLHLKASAEPVGSLEQAQEAVRRLEAEKRGEF